MVRFEGGVLRDLAMSRLRGRTCVMRQSLCMAYCQPSSRTRCVESDVPSAKMLSCKNNSSSSSSVAGVITVYGFVSTLLLNLVMYFSILSIYTDTVASAFTPPLRYEYSKTYRIHLSRLPLLLQIRNLDITDRFLVLSEDPTRSVRNNAHTKAD